MLGGTDGYPKGARPWHREVIEGTGVLAQERELVDIIAAITASRLSRGKVLVRWFHEASGDRETPGARGAFFLKKASTSECGGKLATGSGKWGMQQEAASPWLGLLMPQPSHPLPAASHTLG